jgi:hypothetical protein
MATSASHIPVSRREEVLEQTPADGRRHHSTAPDFLDDPSAFPRLYLLLGHIDTLKLCVRRGER